MTVPQPPELLGAHCSALYGNTLYTFSKTAFLALTLKAGEEWRTLEPGISAEGAACVLAHQGTPEAALYIVGGIVTDTTMGPASGYMGVQRWVFATQKWEIMPTADPVAYNLSGHGAAYIADSKQIIVFAGTAYPTVNTPSANTFLISTKDFTVSSVPGQAPLMAPIVLQWGRNGALLIGGNTGNTNLNSYTLQAGWRSVGNLPAGLPPRGNSGATLIDGPDGSRMLYTFDFTTSPTTVHQKKVLEAGVRRRQTSDGVWSTYNATGAPISPRADVSFAYDDDGLVVITGGSDLDTVLMFDSRKNAWIDTQTVFSSTTEDNDKLSIQETLSSTATPTVSATSKPSVTGSMTSAATISITPITAVGSQMPLNTIQILFIVLGAILALILLLAVAYWLLRRRRRRNMRSSPAGIRGGRTPDPTLSFQDRGLDHHSSAFMKEAGTTFDPHPALHPLHPPRRMNSRNAPIDSWTAVQFPPASSDSNRPFPSGLALKEVGAHSVAVTPTSETSPYHSATLHSGLTVKGRPGDRSSGWSRYFSGITGGNGGNTTAGRRSSDLHPNPYLYSAGAGVIAGGGLAAAAAAPKSYNTYDNSSNTTTNSHSRARAASNVSSVSALSHDTFTGVAPQAARIWDPTRDNLRDPVASSVYPESTLPSRGPSAVWARDERRDTEQSMYSQDSAPTLAPLRVNGAGDGGRRERTESDLSWLNLGRV